MADVWTLCGALMVLLGFTFLFWFVRQLGILEMEAAMMPVSVPAPKPQPQPMVEVINPFKMTVCSSSTLGCVELILGSTQPSIVACYWKVRKQYLDQMVYQSCLEYEEASGENVQNIRLLLDENCETRIREDFTGICSAKKLSYNIEAFMKESPDNIADSQLYDLVVALELTEENRASIQKPSSITAMVTGIELKRQNKNFKPHIIQQFIQTKNGKLFKLKRLYLEEATSHGQSHSNEQENQSSNLCIVCQMLPISRALIPCGHACLCLLCFNKMNTCPMCRQPMLSSFVLGEEPNLREDNADEFSGILKRMKPLEILRGIYNAS